MVGEIDHAADVGETQVAHQVLALCQHTSRIVLVVDQRALEAPRVVVVPSADEQARHTVGHVALAQHGDGLAGFVFLQRRDGTGPEGRGDGVAADVVAAEAIDVGIVNPVFHGINHRHLGGLLAVVQLIDIVVAVGTGERRVVVITVLGNPHVVLGGVVGHPVEPHLHAAAVGGGDKRLQVGQRTEVAVHRVVVTRGIGAAQRADAAQNSARMNRHQPDDIDAQVLQIVQTLLGCGKGTLAGEVIQVQFIDDVMVGDKGALARPDDLSQLAHDVVAVVGVGEVNTATLVVPGENQACRHREGTRIGPFIDLVTALGVTHVGHRGTRPVGTHIEFAVGISRPHPDFGRIVHRAVGLKEHTYLAITRQ